MAAFPPVPPRPDLGDASGTLSAAPATTTLAGFGQRIGGYLLDLLLMLPVAGVLFATRWNTLRALFDWIGAHPGQTTIPRDLMIRFQDALHPVALSFAAIWFVYNTLMVMWRGQTLGKMAARARVVRAVDGNHVGGGRAALRALVPMLGAVLPTPFGLLVPVVVYGWMLFTPRRQGLHDLAAGSIVIRSD
jgi:uncharacterized RDD family membrane protein YckC